MAFGGRSQFKMSEETFDFICTTCQKKGKRVEAVKYCSECCGYCCQPCTDVHTMFPTLENHNLMEVNQASGLSSSLPEFPTERCNKHTGKVLDMYCEGHDVVGCSTCFVKDHKFCQDSHIHSIPDMIDSIFKLSDCKHTQKLLKDMVASMETICDSKEAHLESLNAAKKEALDEVTTFQKALEAIIRKAADASRQHVEDAYTDLKNDILQEKHKAENICENLKATDEKLNQSEGNRAQRFVCTKVGQEMIEEAENEKRRQDVQRNTNLHAQLSFHPDQSLMDYVKTVKYIGQVQQHGKRKHDLYRIKGSRDVITQLSNDSMKCYSRGCCLTHDNQLLVTDYYNKKLKLIDMQTLSVIDHCTLDSEPNGVCRTSKHEAAIACRGKMIQFVSIRNKMIPTRQIKSLTHECYGIAFSNDKLYVTDNDACLYIYDLVGKPTLLKKVSHDSAGNKLFKNSSHVTVNESGSRVFVGDGYNNRLACYDEMGNYLSARVTKDNDLSYTDGVCVDGRGNVFVVGWMSHNVVQYSETGEKVGVVVKTGDGLRDPISVCFHPGLNRLFVTLNNRSEVKMYELE